MIKKKILLAFSSPFLLWVATTLLILPPGLIFNEDVVFVQAIPNERRQVRNTKGLLLQQFVVEEEHPQQRALVPLDRVSGSGCGSGGCDECQGDCDE